MVFLRSAAVLLALCSSAVWAAEDISYAYDALGRLSKVSHAGTVNNGNTACYTYDPADNRSNVKVSIGADCAGVSFSITSNAPVTEGVSAVFTITKTGTAAASVSVNYATANGTAVAPGDYGAASGTLTFTTAQTSQTVSVSTVNDTAVESAETFTVNLSGPTGGATVATGSATATITDDDSGGSCTGVSFAVNNAAAGEGSPLVFTVSKSGSPTNSCAVNYATADGTAVAPGDYAATSGTLAFAVGEASKTVSVVTKVNAITSTEPATETMFLNLTNPSTGATLGDPQGQGTITDDPSAGSMNAPAEGEDSSIEQPLDASSSPQHSSESTDPPPPPPE